MTMYNCNLTIDDFARAFGVGNDELSPAVCEAIERFDFRYQDLSAPDRDRVILDILKKLKSNHFAKVGEQRKDIWEKAWSEYLQNFSSKNCDFDELNPKFINTNPVVRLNQQYVRTADSKFELNFFRVFRRYLFEKYLANLDAVYEFGCGSGFNLVACAELYPEKSIYGLDWSPSSVQIANLMATQGLNVQGRSFDFFAPDDRLELADNSAILTMCALEQIGSKHEAFLQFILSRSPGLCIHMEPLCELYDGENLVDYLAIEYHQNRGYLDGYLTRLQELETQQKIEILQTKRLYFGSLYHEGYSFIVWKPIVSKG
jgi:SAM-dependent methyltransferase